MSGPAVVTGFEGTTVTLTLSLLVQPLAFVTVTVYCVVTVGLANGLATVEELKLVEGDHAYPTPPVA